MRYVAATVFLCLGGIGSAAAAQLTDRVELHGYGNQNYLRTSDNAYLAADEHGSWDSSLLALVGVITLTEKSKLWAQLETESPEPVRFDWFFVDYRLNDRLRVQVGRAKLPFGSYNEIIDAQYLQLSALPPAVYQESAHIAHETYQGIGLDYETDLGTAGGLRAQVWGGDSVEEHEESDEAEGFRNRSAFGARLTYRTPIEGLKLLLSASRTRVEFPTSGDLEWERQAVLSLEYLNRNFDVRAEYATRELGDVKGNVWYVQAGYGFWEKLTPYLRYDSVSTDERLDADPAFYQKTMVVGLGYKIGGNFSVRVEDHINRGYALPVANEEVAAGAGRKNWHLLAASVNFIF